MTTRRSRPTALVLAALLLTIVSTALRTETTDAAWQGRDHAAATVTSGSWPSAGSAYAEVGRVASASGVTFDLLRGGTNPPWPGPSSARSQAVPGTATGTTAGPYSSAGVLGLANELTSRGAVAGTPITGAACAAYGWAPATPAPCATVPSQRVNASATLSSYTLYASLLSLLGLGSTDVVAIPSPVTSSVSCDLTSTGPTYTAAAPSAANVTASNPRGSISVRGGSAVAVPPAGGTTSFDFPQSGSTVVVPGVSGLSAASSARRRPHARASCWRTAGSCGSEFSGPFCWTSGSRSFLSTRRAEAERRVLSRPPLPLPRVSRHRNSRLRRQRPRRQRPRLNPPRRQRP